MRLVVTITFVFYRVTSSLSALFLLFLSGIGFCFLVPLIFSHLIPRKTTTMSQKPEHNPATRQTQSTTAELVDPVTSLRLPKPGGCPHAGAAAAASQTHSSTQISSGLSTNTSEAKSDNPALIFNNNAAATAPGADEVIEHVYIHIHRPRSFRAYHYFDAAYPDHSLRVAYSDDPRYPAGEYPEGAYPTDARPRRGRVDSDSELEFEFESESEQRDGHDDESEGENEDVDYGEGHDEAYDEDLDPRVDFLFDGDEDGGAPHEDWDWDWEGNTDEAVDREDPDTGVDDIKGSETETETDAAAATATATAPTHGGARHRCEAREMNLPYHVHVRHDDARHATTANLVRRRTLLMTTASVCVGLIYAWNWSLNRQT
ncbi:hypothetical protein AYL99_06207 [Fonsecaea erecta]|uniref:Uncharacterized protein n=1 Tax=Fonsecaea erecta TaxID=1367422 RepID=A0A178ZGJ3_9EURO|nr:hypothetical protein AYL99_06207 [Fonsecaea erecta]OAP58910.1 hypothetical protein AYL99_06207 [Fonsecaea erecta]